MYKKMWGCMILLLLFVVPQVHAQGFNLGPQLGYHKSEDADGNFLIGAALRLKLMPIVGVEGSINYRQEEFSDQLTVRSWPVMVSGMIYPLPIVYGVLGAGWYNTTFDFEDIPGVDEDHTEQEFGWHFGAGVELPVGRSKLTGDIRYVFLDYDLGVGFLFGL